MLFFSIQKQHAILTCKSGTVEIEPGAGSKIKVNGVPLTVKKRLTHKDRLLFGKNSIKSLKIDLKFDFFQ